MSSEFEKLLRDARKALPLPDESVTRRARERALAAVRRRSLRRPAAAILAAALVGLGVAIGALIAPSGSAAPEPVGLGFLPERGWSVLQNGGDGTAAEPALAIAANVELSPDDESDGLPLSTLEGLRPDGVVIVATFIARGDQVYYDKRFPSRSLPLKVTDAAPSIEWGVQVRPAQPLGQYQLKAAVDDHNVDVNIYFGSRRPSPALLNDAQRQLDRLVVRADPVPAPTLRPALGAAVSVAPDRIVDRTLICSTVAIFGERFLRVGMTSPKSLPTGKVPAGAFLWTGAAGASEGLAGLEAGPASGRTTGGVHYFPGRCRVTTKRVPFTSRGLPGPPVLFDQYLRCSAPRRVLVRMRAMLDRRAVWRRSQDLVIARGNFTTAALAVRTEAGRPVAFFKLESGKTRLWTAGSCTN